MQRIYFIFVLSAFLFWQCTESEFADWNPYEKPALQINASEDPEDPYVDQFSELSSCNQNVHINLKNADCRSELIPILSDVLARGILNSFCQGCHDYRNRQVVDRIIYKNFFYLIEGRESDILVVRDGPDNAFYGNQIKRHIDEIENQVDDILTIYGFIPSGTVPNCKRGTTQSIRVGYLVTYCKPPAPPIWDF